MKNEDCIFCKIAEKELDAEIVLEDDEVVAFHDINGRAPVHVLVIPRQHVESFAEISDLPDSAVKRLFEASREVAEKSRHRREWLRRTH